MKEEVIKMSMRLSVNQSIQWVILLTLALFSLNVFAQVNDDPENDPVTIEEGEYDENEIGEDDDIEDATEEDLENEPEDETTAVQAEPPPRELTAEEIFEINSFKIPNLNDEERSAILAKYKHVDEKRVISRKLLNEALIAYHTNLDILRNRSYLTVIDYSDHSKTTRFYVIDMKSGESFAHHVAHGSGSDKSKTGWARVFGNTPGSNRTALGFMRTAETYSGKHGLSLRLDGLSATNSNVRARAIVIHGAKYVRDQSVKQGTSWGCPALSLKQYRRVINLIKGGSLIYAGLGD